jgi:hypothetical protein
MVVETFEIFDNNDGHHHPVAYEYHFMDHQ